MMNESGIDTAHTKQAVQDADGNPAAEQHKDRPETEQVADTARGGPGSDGSDAATDTQVNTSNSDNQALADDTEALQAQLQAAQETAEENWSKLVRLQAEMDNLRKRTARDVESAHKFALEKFINELLPVIDSLELGINAADSSGDAEGLRQGMELTLKKFLDVVGKFGVEVIDPLGEKFNPELHEAVSMQESDEAESGTVITVMQKGFSLNQRLIRPAMVVVAK